MDKKICAVDDNEQGIKSNGKLIIFGIDSVFYNPKIFSADFDRLTLKVISEQSGVELGIIEQKAQEKKVSYLMNRYGLQAENVALEVEKKLDPAAYLFENDELVNLLHELRQKYKVSIVSNKPRVFIQRVLEQLGVFETLYDTLVIAQDLGRYIRKNLVIEETMRLFPDISSGNVIYITGKEGEHLDNVLNTLDIDNGMQVEGPEDLIASLPGYLKEIEEETQEN